VGEKIEERAEWDLDGMSGATRLINWTADQFGSVKDLDVVEVGSGIGTYTDELLKRGARSVLAIEPDPHCLERLEARFGGDERVVLSSNVMPGAEVLRDGNVGDLVVCQNVLEHIEDDRSAFEEMVSALRTGGRLFLLVPANPWLYGSLDEEFDHFRRYRKDDLLGLAALVDLEGVNVRPFNTLGIPGWWIKGKSGRREVGNGSLRAYEAMLRFWRPIEDRFEVPVGLSLILTGWRA